MKVTINFRVPYDNTYVATAQISEGITLKQVVKHILQNIMKSSIQIDEFYSDEQMKTKTDGKKIVNGDQFYVNVQKHNYENWFKQNPINNNKTKDKPYLQGTPLTNNQSEVNSPNKILRKEEPNPQNVHDSSNKMISTKQIQVDPSKKLQDPPKKQVEINPPKKQVENNLPKKQLENNPPKKQPDPLQKLLQDPQNSIKKKELPINPSPPNNNKAPPNNNKAPQASEGCCVLI